MHGTSRLFPVFISPIAWDMCEHLHYESAYFKELHQEQEYYTLVYFEQISRGCETRGLVPTGTSGRLVTIHDYGFSYSYEIFSSIFLDSFLYILNFGYFRFFFFIFRFRAAHVWCLAALLDTSLSLYLLYWRKPQFLQMQFSSKGTSLR